jgi:hypothetical protein
MDVLYHIPRTLSIYRQTKRAPKRSFYPILIQSLATAASFAISRAFLARLARRGIHFARIIALRFAAAIGTKHFIRVHTYQFFKTLSASFAFVL